MLPAQIGIVTHVLEGAIDIAEHAGRQLQAEFPAQDRRRRLQWHLGVPGFEQAVVGRRGRGTARLHRHAVAQRIAIIATAGLRLEFDRAGEVVVGIDRDIDIDRAPLERRQRYRLLRLRLRGAAGLDRHRHFARGLRTIEHGEAGAKAIPTQHLVGHRRAQLDVLGHRELATAEAEPVLRCDGQGQHAPVRQIVRRLEFEMGLTLRVGIQRRVPIGHELLDGPQRQRGTTITARTGALLLDLLTADQSRQQPVVVEIQRVELQQTVIGIEVVLAALDQVEHGIVEHRDRVLHRRQGGTGLMRSRGQTYVHTVSGAIALGLRHDLHIDPFVGIGHRQLRVAHAKRRLAEVRTVLGRRRGTRRQHHHGDIGTRQIIGLHRNFDHRRIAFKRLHPGVEHAIAFHADQRLRARIRVLDQIARGVANGIGGLLRREFQRQVGPLLPDHVLRAACVQVQPGLLQTVVGVSHHRGDAVAAGFIRGETAAGGGCGGAALAHCDFDPFAGVLR